jgi:hypothetical protein
MVSKLIAFLAWIAVTTAGYGALDLTPQLSTRELEGAKFRQLVFHDGKRQVTFEPPIGWDYHGGGSKLTLIPPLVRTGEASLEINTAEASPSDETRLASLRESTLREIPKDAVKVDTVSQDTAVIQVDGKKVAEVTVAYELNGQRYMRGTFLVDLTDSQLKAKVTGRAEDFAKLHAAIQKSLCSFQWLPPARSAQR